MSAAHKSHRRGSAIIKKKYRGVPLIRRATGTSDPATVRRIAVMYDALYAQGRLDILTAIARGRLHPLAVLSEWQLGRDVHLPPADVFPPLGQSWDAWARGLANDSHRRAAEGTRRHMEIRTDATVAELPALLRSYRVRCAEKHRTFNLARAHAQAFIRDTLGRSHALWGQVRDVLPYRQSSAALRRGKPWLVEEIRAACEKMGPVNGATAWTLAATGMGPKEYWQDGFTVEPDRIAIHGKKRYGRERVVPRWTLVTGPGSSEKTFRKALARATGGRVKPYDLRRCFARWCEEAGITRTNIAAYLGHTARTMSDLYRVGEMEGQIAEDADRLRAYAGEGAPVAPLRVAR